MLQPLRRAFDAALGFLGEIGWPGRNVFLVKHGALGQGGIGVIGVHHAAALFGHSPGERVKENAFGQGDTQFG